MSSCVFPLLMILATFAVCGRSLYTTREHEDASSLDRPSDDNEVESNFLESKILRGIDLFGNFCDDPYVALCGSETKNHTRSIHLKQAYPYIRSRLIDILSQPVAIKEVSALSVEKRLFRNCMNLGSKSDGKNELATMNFVGHLFERVFNANDSWQNIDNQLDLRGFHFTFFEVGVERDSDNPRQNVIVVKPPSFVSIKDLYDLTILAFDANNSQLESNFAWRFYDSVDREAVQRFFRRWAKIFSLSSTQRKQEKMSLTKWNQQYNAKSVDGATNKINWQTLIVKDFQRVGIDVTAKEAIVIRDKAYFSLLAELLGDTSNDLIVGAIKTKLILQNIRYIDYKYAEALQHRKRSLFCYANTKLYGASFRLLRDLKKGDSNTEANYEILDTMLRNIADVLLFAIAESNELSSMEKTYLRAQVKSITSNVVKFNKYRHVVDDYYKNYKVSPSYFASIVNYRKMLKEKELASLTNYSKHFIESEPFSVVDLAKMRNRFVLNVLANSFLLSKVPIPSELQKEIHYGIYGVSIASFLYGLLNEHGFDNAVNLTGRVDWYDHPNYPAKTLQCFVGGDVHSYGWSFASETVTQIYGVHVAYKAMLKDYSESQVKRPQDYLILTRDFELKPIEADRLFFMSYAKYHCDLSQQVLRTILLNLDEYNSAFDCGSLHDGQFVAQCPLNGFQIQRKRYFVNKPF